MIAVMKYQNPNTLILAGMGPGNPDLILPSVQKEALKAENVIGNRRHLDLFRKILGEDFKPARTVELRAEIEPDRLVEEVRESLAERPTLVLISGDPGYSRVTKLLKDNFPGNPIQIIPGLSSIQYLFAKLALSWNRAVFMNLVGRREELDEALESGASIGIVADDRHDPAYIARHVFRVDPDRTIHVGMHLSEPGEVILTFPAKEGFHVHPQEQTVVVIEGAAK